MEKRKILTWAMGISLLMPSFCVLLFIVLIRTTAQDGFPAAQSELGRWYDLGIWLHEENASQAKSWYLKAAEQGYPKAQYNLALIFEEESQFQQAAHWYLQAALQDFPPAQAHLGVLYANGTGFAQNTTEAAKWFAAAANNGHPFGQFLFGISYFYGDGVEIDREMAFYWMQKSAEQGHPRAQGFLALLYLDWGSDADLEQARYWAKEALAGGDESTANTLRMIDERTQ